MFWVLWKLHWSDTRRRLVVQAEMLVRDSAVLVKALGAGTIEESAELRKAVDVGGGVPQ
jgi:hypothetical protein